MRQISSGTTIVGYSYNKDSTNAAIFVAYVAFILKKSGVDMDKIHFQ